jgi:hypothetical protein
MWSQVRICEMRAGKENSGTISGCFIAKNKGRENKGLQQQSGLFGGFGGCHILNDVSGNAF